jgi:tRNA U34 5-methylaminomethyl-2-thiouridine-forming methyltransferase MnmC
MLRTTADGSKTLYSEKFGQHYHSVFGAETESLEVFIQLGLLEATGKFKEINLFELGFGSGLNARLSARFAQEKGVFVNYTGIEAYPVEEEFSAALPEETAALHALTWDDTHQINPWFRFRKIKAFLEDFSSEERFNVVYFDAFAPESQPELWTVEVFEKIAGLMVEEGVMTTYCSKVSVQRNMRAAGFKVEKHPGPPHKREVLRAIKAKR